MKIIFLSIISLIACSPIMAQTIDTVIPTTIEEPNEAVFNFPDEPGKPAPVSDTSVFMFVEQMPEFKGGQIALQNYLAKNLQYPKAASESNIQGTVVLEFIVNKDSTISNIQALRKLDGGCTEEAVRVVKAMPKWIHGKQNGIAVRVKYRLPIAFKIK